MRCKFDEDYDETPKEDCQVALQSDSAWQGYANDAKALEASGPSVMHNYQFELNVDDSKRSVTIKIQFLNRTGDQLMLYRPDARQVLAVEKQGGSYQIVMVEDSEVHAVVSCVWYMVHRGQPRNVSFVTSIGDRKQRKFLAVTQVEPEKPTDAQQKLVESNGTVDRHLVSQDDHGRWQFRCGNAHRTFGPFHLLPLTKTMPFIRLHDCIPDLHSKCTYRIARYRVEWNEPKFLSLANGRLLVKHASEQVDTENGFMHAMSERIFNRKNRTRNVWKFKDLQKITDQKYSASLLHLVDLERNPFEVEVSDKCPVIIERTYPAWTISFTDSGYLFFDVESRKLIIDGRNPQDVGGQWFILDTSK